MFHKFLQIFCYVFQLYKLNLLLSIVPSQIKQHAQRHLPRNFENIQRSLEKVELKFEVVQYFYQRIEFIKHNFSFQLYYYSNLTLTLITAAFVCEKFCFRHISIHNFIFNIELSF